MTNTEILKLIDNGSIYYIRILGNAQHMEYIKYPYYSMIRPKSGEQGISFVYDIQFDKMPQDEIAKHVTEIKSLNIPTWWGVGLPDEIHELVFGAKRQEPNSNDEEFCMAMFPEEKLSSYKPEPSIEVKTVKNHNEFAVWADITNQILHTGTPLIINDSYFHLSESGIMPCYIGYYNGVPASVASTLNNDGETTLEFVATLPEYRGKGLATAVCSKAVEDLFGNQAKVITLRSSAMAKNLYLALGFKIY